MPQNGYQPVLELGLAGAFERLLNTATRLGITVLDASAGESMWPDDRVAAIVAFGEHITLKPGLDDALRTDVLAMALIAAAVMGDRPAGHPCAITAPGGYVLISRTRAADGESGPGRLATLLVRRCGWDTPSAAFEYSAPAMTDPSPWAPWTHGASDQAATWRGQAVAQAAGEISRRIPVSSA